MRRLGARGGLRFANPPLDLYELYFVYGDGDKNIPAQALGFMAERADSKRTIVVKDASHVVMVSHPQVVAELIAQAAQ